MKKIVFAVAAMLSALLSAAPAAALQRADFGLPTYIEGIAGTTININAAIRNSGDQTIVFDQHLAGLSLQRFSPYERFPDYFEIIDYFTWFAPGDPDPRFGGLTLAPGQTINFVLGQVHLPTNFLYATSNSAADISFVFNGEYASPTFALRSFAVLNGWRNYESPIEFTTASISFVPEPATWAMMLFGFGIVGLGLRIGRRSTYAATELRI